MKVDANSNNVQLNNYLNQVRNQQQASSTQAQQDQTRQAAGGDKVELSDKAKEVQQASQALKSMPDTRTDMVAKTKLEVEQGTYKVNGTKVATGMLKESFENDTILQKIDTKV
jgi:negative regulator of flagellin synthesis FlgM